MYTGVSAEPLPRAPCEGDDRVQDLSGHTGPGMSEYECGSECVADVYVDM